MVGMPALISVALKVPTPGTSRSSTRLARGKHRAAALALFFVGRIHELQRHLGAPRRSRRRARSRRSPAPRRAGSAHGPRWSCRCWPARCARCRRRRPARGPGSISPAAIANGPDGGRQVAAVARPVDEGLGQWRPGRTGSRRRDRAASPRETITVLLVTGGRAAHAVDLLAVGSGLPITRSSSASRAGPGCCAACRAGPAGRKNTPLLVPPRM